MNRGLKALALLVGLCSTVTGNSHIIHTDDVDDPAIINFAASSHLYRDYNKPVTQSDRNDIRYIVTNLANNSMINIMFNRASIERAGDRIDPVHPLKFLLVIFSDEEMKAAVHNIKGRSLIWKDFYAGLRDSLQNESNEHNLDQYIPDFAKQLGINPAPLGAAAEQHNWDKFLQILFTQVPRNPDRNRYDD